MVAFKRFEIFILFIFHVWVGRELAFYVRCTKQDGLELDPMCEWNLKYDMCGAYDGWTCSIKVGEKFSIQEWEDFTLNFKHAIKERERHTHTHIIWWAACCYRSCTPLGIFGSQVGYSNK